MADLILRSKFLHRRARRVGARCAESSLSDLSILGIASSRWRVRVAERWAFAFMSVTVIRFLIVAAFLFLWFGHVLRALFRGIFSLAGDFHEKLPGVASGAAKVRPVEWYNFGVVTFVFSILALLCVYAARPLLPLNVMLGNRDAEVNMHRGNLYKLERRLRAALILYGYAAQCGRALSARGWVRDSLTNSACVLRQAEREVLQAWKKSRPARMKPPRHQRAQLKNHAGLVVAALRAQAARVDADPEKGLRELGSLLVRVGDRLAEGRVGALLDEAELADLQPVHDREALKTVAAAVLVAAGAVGVAVLRLPAEVAAPLTTLMGITVLVTLYRKTGGAETVSLLLGGK